MYLCSGGVLCRMDGPLDELTDAELKRWARHNSKHGRIPYNKRFRTCDTIRGSGRRHVRVKAQGSLSFHLMYVDLFESVEKMRMGRATATDWSGHTPGQGFRRRQANRRVKKTNLKKIHVRCHLQNCLRRKLRRM